MPSAILDAHHHLWNPVSNVPDVGYKWLKEIGKPKPFGDPTPIQRDYLLDEFLGETGALAPNCSIEGSVHLQADGAIPDPMAETRFVEQLAADAGHPLAIVGFVDLTSDAAETALNTHLKSPGFRGVRQILSRLDDRPDISFVGEHLLQNAKWRDQFGLLADHGLSFDAQLYPEQMADAAAFFSSHPTVPVIIDHCGSPWDLSADGFARWKEAINRFATLPQISMKVSGFGMFDKDWTAETFKPWFETMAELFGPSRLMFGSNFPVDSLMRPYVDIARDLAELTSGWSEADRHKFFYANAARIYRVPGLG